MTRVLFALLLSACRTTTTASARPPEPDRGIAMALPRPGADCAEVRARAEALRPQALAALAETLGEPDLTARASALPALGPCTRLPEDAEGALVEAWARHLGHDAVVSGSLTGCVDPEGVVVEAMARAEPRVGSTNATLVARLRRGRLEPIASATWREDDGAGSGGNALVQVRGLGDLDGDGTRDVLYAEHFVTDEGEPMRLWAALGNGRKVTVDQVWGSDYAHLVARDGRVLVLTASTDLDRGDASSLRAWSLRFGVLEREPAAEQDLQRRLAPGMRRLAALTRLASRQLEHPLVGEDVAVLGPLTPALEGCLFP